MMKRYTHIAGLSEARRLPRIGKLRLGMKALSRAGKEIPRELDYFLLPEPGLDDPASAHEAFRRFRQVYGEKPRELEVVIPSEDTAVFFPQRYKCYGSSGLRCVGDGTTADRIGSALGKEGAAAAEFFEVACPTPSECEFAEAHGCRPVGSLFIILPQVSLGGCFQIDVSGINSILNINSAVEHVRTLCGRISGLIVRKAGVMRSALNLKRISTKTQGGGRVSVHYPMTLELQMNLGELEELLGKRVVALPALPAQQSSVTESDVTLPTTEGDLPFVPDDDSLSAPIGDAPAQRTPSLLPGVTTIDAEKIESVWARVEAVFVELNTPPNVRQAYLKRYGAVPEELLAILHKKAERRT